MRTEVKADSANRTAALAPAFSLAPEVPGIAAADITARQLWWFATVASAGIAMWLFAFGGTWPLWSVAVILLAAPHLIGAPQPYTFAGPVPSEIAEFFAAHPLGVGPVTWVILGRFAAYFLDKEQRRQF